MRMQLIYWKKDDGNERMYLDSEKIYQKCNQEFLDLYKEENFANVEKLKKTAIDYLENCQDGEILKNIIAWTLKETVEPERTMTRWEGPNNSWVESGGWMYKLEI
jgi:hypothetical protein